EVERDVHRCLPIYSGALEHACEISPVRDQQRLEIDEDIARVPAGGDGERPRHRMTKRIGHGPGHRRAGRRRDVRIHYPELDAITGTVKANEIGPERSAAVQAGLANAL